MARLHRLSAVAPTISVLLLLAALASAAAAADAPVKKVGITFFRPNTEEARWLDRHTGTHTNQQLGTGPIRMRRATAEEAKWLDRMSGNAGRAGDQSGGSGGGGDNYIEFDDDNPYIEALRAWASRQAERITVEDDQEENPLQDRKCEARHELAGYDPSSTAHDYVAASER